MTHQGLEAIANTLASVGFTAPKHGERREDEEREEEFTMPDQNEQLQRGLAPRVVLRLADENGVLHMAATRLLTRLIELEAEGRKRIDIAVTGGSDGIEMLRLVGLDPLVDSVDWSRVHMWWGDERFVPANDPDRNALQARHALLDMLVAKKGLPESNIHEIPADPRSATERNQASAEDDARAVNEGAVKFQQMLLQELGNMNGEPRMDIAWWGVGPDAHFASLMPGLPQINIADPSQLTCGVTNSPNMPPLRISMTVPMIQRSLETWVIASGEKKRDALAKALGNFDDPAAPITFAAGRKQTLWMVDEASAPRA